MYIINQPDLLFSTFYFFIIIIGIIIIDDLLQNVHMQPNQPGHNLFSARQYNLEFFFDKHLNILIDTDVLC